MWVRFQFQCGFRVSFSNSIRVQYSGSEFNSSSGAQIGFSRGFSISKRGKASGLDVNSSSGCPASRRMSRCNWLDLQALGSQPVMPKNLPDHWGVQCVFRV